MDRKGLHLRQARRLRKKIGIIESAHPFFNYKDRDLILDLVEREDLLRRLVKAEAEIDKCCSDNPTEQCEKCDCWKSGYRS